jgi:hypothetical protein
MSDNTHGYTRIKTTPRRIHIVHVRRTPLPIHILIKDAMRNKGSTLLLACIRVITHEIFSDGTTTEGVE